jgi:hypothetical protein
MISQEYFNKIKKSFNNDENKTWTWFKSRHPHFGMFSPLDMLKLGRESKVKSFIDHALERNKSLWST